MPISLKASGSYTNLVSTGSVGIPGSPAAGDRMFLFATSKDYSNTLSVSAGWTAIGSQYADGTVSSGNGTGSMAIHAWYRDWQSGDTDPTVTSLPSSGDGGAAVIQVWQKSSGETWDTPLTTNAAWTANTANVQQTVSGSTSLAITNGAVVMAYIGIRDEVTSITRPTTGIDVASGITWDGDYVESPGTHYSSSTSLDAAADLGYRLVTTGGTETPRFTATLDTSETGAIKFVVQGVTGTLIDYTITADAGTYAITGTAGDLERGLITSSDIGTYAINGPTCNLVRSLRIYVDEGSYNIATPHVTSLYSDSDPVMAVDSGSYAVTGTAILCHITSKVDSGSYSISTPVETGFIRGQNFESGSYSVSDGGTTFIRFMIEPMPSIPYTIASEVEFLYSKRIAADPGVYVYDGAVENATFIYGAGTMPAREGTYTAVFDVNIGYQRKFSVDPGSYTLTGQATTYSRGYYIRPTFPGSYQNFGQPPWITKASKIEATGGVYSIASPETFIGRSKIVVASEGAYLITGTDVSFFRSQTMTAAGGSYSIATPVITQLTMINKIQAEGGIYTITGTAATFTGTRRLTAEAGSYSYSGQTVGLTPGRYISAATSLTVITGLAVDFRRSLAVSAAAGSVAVSGTAATFNQYPVLLADPGSYSIAGTEIPSYSSIREITLAAGSYALTFTAFTGLPARKIVADTTGYTVTGADTTLIRNSLIIAAGGTVTVSGTAATFPRIYKMVADAGTYAATGTAATIYSNTRVLALAGSSYAITGAAATLRIARAIAASNGLYSIVGGDAIRLDGGVLTADSGVYVIGAATTTVQPLKQIAASAGNYSVTGADVTWTQVRKMVANTGQYTHSEGVVSFSSTIATRQSTRLTLYGTSRKRYTLKG